MAAKGRHDPQYHRPMDSVHPGRLQGRFIFTCKCCLGAESCALCHPPRIDSTPPESLANFLHHHIGLLFPTIPLGFGGIGHALPCLSTHTPPVVLALYCFAVQTVPWCRGRAGEVAAKPQPGNLAAESNNLAAWACVLSRPGEDTYNTMRAAMLLPRPGRRLMTKCSVPDVLWGRKPSRSWVNLDRNPVYHMYMHTRYVSRGMSSNWPISSRTLPCWIYRSVSGRNPFAKNI